VSYEKPVVREVSQALGIDIIR